MEHHRAGRLAEAEQQYRVALTLAPRHADALQFLGALYVQVGKTAQAFPLLQNALQVQPKNPEILCNLGVCWRNANDLQQAVRCFEEALSLKPDHLDASSNLGIVLLEMGRSADARAQLERTLQRQPDHTGTLSKLGMSLYHEGKSREALELYDRALTHATATTPEYQHTLWLKSLALLDLGDYRDGWKLYETGLGDPVRRGLNPFAAARPWDGKPAPGKHLLIWCEGGLGDSLQFVRYAELCKHRVGKVSVLCPKPLLRLFKALPFIDDAFDVPQEGRSTFDEHIPMMSLPHRFDTVLETVPATIPYLRIDPTIQEQWAPKFSGGEGIKIGLVWAGGSHKGNVIGSFVDRQRSVGLLRMKPWLDPPGARFYNLQRDEPAGQIAALGLTDRLTDFMGEVTDFADTAAIVQNLDLVITVDTSVAHLAGGLGKPVWILSRYNADWRWLQNRPTNPWYPTARIFGQPTLGDWDSVMAEVGRELAKEIAKRSAVVTTHFALSPFRAQ